MLIRRDVPSALSTNDTELELQAVLSGQVIGQLSGISAARPIREGRLVPLLVGHVTDHISVHIYYGSRNAQPKRVRAFIDMAVEHFDGGKEFLLRNKELTAAETTGRRTLLGRS